MLDRTIGLSALALLIGFMAILIGFVPHPDLIAVIVVVVLMAGYDFYRSLFAGRDGRR
ncbi:MAG: hypothetical protein RLO51_20340 [Thalassobaculum sp.]|uniref:hypothetical protein n=1 Tax=Thalassobaculum sp. TaxID=2022740 RepID=UPI0032ECA003